MWIDRFQVTSFYFYFYIMVFVWPTSGFVKYSGIFGNRSYSWFLYGVRAIVTFLVFSGFQHKSTVYQSFVFSDYKETERLHMERLYIWSVLHNSREIRLSHILLALGTNRNTFILFRRRPGVIYIISIVIDEIPLLICQI